MNYINDDITDDTVGAILETASAEREGATAAITKTNQLLCHNHPLQTPKGPQKIARLYNVKSVCENPIRPVHATNEAVQMHHEFSQQHCPGKGR